MIFLLVGKAGAGKTFIAKAMENEVKDSFVIDGDEVRNEMSNNNRGKLGRQLNMTTCLSRARTLSDLGFTVFASLQAPYKQLRNRYLTKYDRVILVENFGDNPKDKLGYNDGFDPDYSDINLSISLQDFTTTRFKEIFFPKVLVPARFQGFHKGHKVILEEAKRLSPSFTIALRADEGDKLPLDENIKLLEDVILEKGYNAKVIKSPNLDDDIGWLNLSKSYDYLVQGNQIVIDKFSLDLIELKFIPRYGDISATKIRQNPDNMGAHIDKKVMAFVKKFIN